MKKLLLAFLALTSVCQGQTYWNVNQYQQNLQPKIPNSFWSGYRYYEYKPAGYGTYILTVYELVPGYGGWAWQRVYTTTGIVPF